jgi:beta-N-acetylhexosaminidase
MSQFMSIGHLVAILIFVSGLFPNYLLAQEPVRNPASTPDSFDQAIHRMTLDQKVGQLFMLGFPQTSLDPKLKAFITRVKPGSFLLFKRNISSLDQVRAFNKDLTDLSLHVSGVRPLIAVDQEGGFVSRIPVQPAIPSALAFGQTNSLPLSESYGEEVGNLLINLGFNMNLAPVLDLSDPQQPSFIGVRSFGGNPKSVGELGYAVSQGMIKSKLIPTAKHFPGMGSSLPDPHSTLVTRITSSEEFFANDLKPFEKFASLGPETAIMLSHLSYPVLDSSNVPALFSEKIVTGLLRNKLGFKGLVITDDLMMQGASQYANPGEAAVLALNAGADIVMVTWSFKAQEKALQRVKEAILKKEVSLQDVHQKIRRILIAKALSTPAPQNTLTKNSPQTTLPMARLREIEQVVLESNLKNQDEKFDAIKTHSEFCVISPSRHFLESFKRGTSLKLKYYFVNQDSASGTLEAMIRKNSCENSIISVYGKKSIGMLESLPPEMKSKVFLVNLNAPMLLDDESAYLSVINLYFPHINAGQKIAQHISNRKPADYSPRTTSK